MFSKILGLILAALVSFSVSAAHVDTLEVYSLSMRKPARCVVVTPDTYTFSGAPYPVVYLLHGWSGNYAGWLSDAPHIRALSDQYGVIIVCPDGGYDSWYLDSPVDSTVRYDTHISREIIPFVDHYYHTRNDRSGRAIAGLSMGGHGAMILAARHPDLFGVVGSMCGGLDLRPFKVNDWDLQGVLGSPTTHWENWENNSIVNLVDQFKKGDLEIAIDCGADDFFLSVNREMHQKLLAAKIPHAYTERPGEHNAAYWGEAIRYQMVFFDQYFKRK